MRYIHTALVVLITAHLEDAGAATSLQAALLHLILETAVELFRSSPDSRDQ